MTFELRKLKSSDIFPMVTIISKIGLDQITASLDPKMLKEIADKAKNDSDSVETMQYIAGLNVSTKIANVIFANLPKARKDIYSFLASVSGMTVKELEDLDLDVFLEMVLAFVQKDEFKSFFKVALSFIR